MSIESILILLEIDENIKIYQVETGKTITIKEFIKNIKNNT